MKIGSVAMGQICNVFVYLQYYSLTKERTAISPANSQVNDTQMRRRFMTVMPSMEFCLACMYVDVSRMPVMWLRRSPIRIQQTPNKENRAVGGGSASLTPTSDDI